MSLMRPHSHRPYLSGSCNDIILQHREPPLMNPAAIAHSTTLAIMVFWAIYGPLGSGPQLWAVRHRLGESCLSTVGTDKSACGRGSVESSQWGQITPVIRRSRQLDHPASPS